MSLFLLDLEWTAVSSKEKTSSGKINSLFKLSNVIILVLLVSLAWSVSLIFKLNTELGIYSSEAFDYRKLKREVNACQNQIRNTDADLRSIKTDLQDLRVLRSDLVDDFVRIVAVQDLNIRLDIAKEQEAILKQMETELVSIADRVDSNLHGGLEHCQFPSVPNDSVWSAS